MLFCHSFIKFISPFNTVLVFILFQCKFPLLSDLLSLLWRFLYLSWLYFILLTSWRKSTRVWSLDHLMSYWGGKFKDQMVVQRILRSTSLVEFWKTYTWTAHWVPIFFGKICLCSGAGGLTEFWDFFESHATGLEVAFFISAGHLKFLFLALMTRTGHWWHWFRPLVRIHHVPWAHTTRVCSDLPWGTQWYRGSDGQIPYPSPGGAVPG